MNSGLAFGEWQNSRDYEQGIPAARRVRQGQYYSPDLVCDLILSLSLKPEVQQVLEPGCGAGNFLVRASERVHALTKLPLTECLTTLQGVELDEQAAQLALLQLKNLAPNAEPRLLVANFISPAVDDLGQFDAIIGNPPYVRQEYLAQSEGLAKQAMLAYLTEKYADYLQRYPAQKALFSQTTDLYLWFFLQAATLLKPGGTLAFITSNSWLNTSFGQAFRLFLGHHFKIKALVESACERWFTDAAINPLILILEKKLSILTDELSTEPTRFIRFLTPLEQWMPIAQEDDYWHRLAAKIQTLPNDADIDYKLVDSTQLWAQKNWAFLLRAPQEVCCLQAEPGLWLRLDELGQVRYPLKTGINRFFYLSRAQAEALRIEPEFLFPVLRSSRSVKRYRVDTNTCEEYLFSCGLSVRELETAGKIGALGYIQWAQGQSAQPRQKRGKPIPWPEVPSVQSNRPWYYVRPLPPAHLLCNRFIDQRFFFPLCDGAVMEDQTFYGLTLCNPATTPPLLVAALLNCTLSYVLVEFSGRTNLGEGVLQFARGDMAGLPVLNPALYTVDEQQAIGAAFELMAQRPILPQAEELASADRLALDMAILNPLCDRIQCTEDVRSFRERLAGYLLGRVRERIQLARSARRRNA